MKQEYEINNVKYQVAIETMKKEVKETKAQRDEGIAELQNALSKYMDDNQDGINRLDQLRFNLDEANVTIEKLTLNERELRKSLDQSLNEKKNEEKEKIEAMSSNQVVLTVSLYLHLHLAYVRNIVLVLFLSQCTTQMSPTVILTYFSLMILPCCKYLHTRRR